MPLLRFVMAAVPAALLAALLVSPPLPAQTTTLDEGVYRLLSGGQEIGRETFAIRQSGAGAGAVIMAHGRVVTDDRTFARDLNSTLEVRGAALRPMGYQLVQRGTEPRTITGQLVGNRFSIRTVSPAGEMMRELIAGDRAVLVDDHIVHHYYFLGRRLQETARGIPVLVPQRNRQVTVDVNVSGPEPIQVAGERVQARLAVVRPPGDDPVHVWLDADGRILRLEVPARRYVAERVALPR
jgi:hypothetical protein